jgi:HK97 family phage prohead protease
LEQVLFRFANFSAVGPLDFEGIAATSQVCPQDGFALDIRGGDITRFSDGKGALLLEHDKYQIVGTCGLRKTATRLMMNGRFTSPGVSETADQARRLLKDGALNGLSLKFSVHKSEPLPGGGRRALTWTAYEVSLCAIPADPGTVVTQRALSEIWA